MTRYWVKAIELKALPAAYTAADVHSDVRTPPHVDVYLASDLAQHDAQLRVQVVEKCCEIVNTFGREARTIDITTALRQRGGK